MLCMLALHALLNFLHLQVVFLCGFCEALIAARPEQQFCFGHARLLNCSSLCIGPSLEHSTDKHSSNILSCVVERACRSLRVDLLND